MALQLVKQIAPCFTYAKSGDGISSILHFFFDPVKDLYLMYAMLTNTSWPPWSMNRVAWNAADGSRNEEYSASGVSIWFLYTTCHIGLGGLNKHYACGNGFLIVKEVDWQNQSYPGFECYNWPERDPIVFRHAIVNRNDAIVVGTCAWPILFVYNYDTHALLSTIAVLDNLQAMAYESDTHLWCVHSSGQLAKINYQTGRHEMLSRIKDPNPTDKAYYCAFDTNRHRLVILRWKPDVEGVCQLQFEFYHPVPQAQQFTAPVPVTSLKANSQATFTGHVLGDAGEGIASQTVTASLASPASGSLNVGRSVTGTNGAFTIEYGAPNGEAAETLTVATEI